MRAEAQDHVDTINAALALLRRFLDWDRAVRRLDELNAKVEDPTLWDNPKAAQDVMRERRRLDEAITATRSIEKEMGDTVELIELAEMEGDEALAGKALRKDGEQGKATFVTLMGAEKAREQARALVDQAIGHVAGHGSDARLLEALARFVIERDR